MKKTNPFVNVLNLVFKKQPVEKVYDSSRLLVALSLADFEKAADKLKLTVDALLDDHSRLEANQQFKETKFMGIIPVDQMPAAKMKRLIFHWTAGGPHPNSLELKDYHFIIDQQANIHRGIHSVDDNQAPIDLKDYAAHTLHCNSGSIGISLCGMMGAVEKPFSPGPAPINETQWKRAALVAATLLQNYRIPIAPDTCLSHAEVQTTLGIQQKGKWDIAVLPWNPKEFNTAKKCGDAFRAEVKKAIGS